MKFGFRITLVRGILDSLSCIPDFKAQVRIPQAKFSQNPDSLTLGDTESFLVSSRMRGGALRDDTKYGRVADYSQGATFLCFEG